MDQNIILIGFMGAKKASLGYRLAHMANMRFVDTRDYVADRQARLISAVSPYYLPYDTVDKELELIEIISSQKGIIVACDMEIANDEYSMTKIKNSGFVVWLSCGLKTSLERASSRDPLNTMSHHQREQYYLRYQEVFSRYADMVFDTSGNEDNFSLNYMCRRLNNELWKRLDLSDELSPQAVYSCVRA